MAFDENVFSEEFTTTVSGSGNTSTNNSTNVAVDLDNVGNTTNSTSGSGNQAWTINDSFKDDSGNETWDVSHSGNTGSYNTDISFTDNSDTDNSVNAGLRSYDTGFSGGLGLGGAGDDLMVNNQNSIVDQSVNQNILAGDGVKQLFSSESVVASGTGAMAAGGDIDISQEVDRSTTITSGGDILIDGSTKNETTTIDSGNISNVSVEITDSSQDWDISDSGNTYSATLGINDSFNETDTSATYEDWNVDADVIWDSNAAVIGDVDIDG